MHCIATLTTAAACARYTGKLGSIDANRNELLLGWDTDMFPTDPALSTYVMKRVIEQGGLQVCKSSAAAAHAHSHSTFTPIHPFSSQPGGLNFDAKIRRESTEIEDLFIGHINGMDATREASRYAKLIADGTIDKRSRRVQRVREYEDWEALRVGCGRACGARGSCKVGGGAAGALGQAGGARVGLQPLRVWLVRRRSQLDGGV